MVQTVQPQPNANLYTIGRLPGAIAPKQVQAPVAPYGMDPATYAAGEGSMNFGDPGFGGNEFDFGGAMKNFSMGAQGIAGLAGAYNSYKQMGLMEDQLSMQKAMANRNIANTAATTNRMLDDRAGMAAQMTSGADYGTQEFRDAKAKLQTTVDGSRIGK